MKKLLFIAFTLICGFTRAQGVDTNFPEPNNQIASVKYDSVHNNVYVGGYFSFFGGLARQKFAVMNATTGALLPWAITCNGTVWDFKVSGNSLYITGDFTTINGSGRNHFAKFDITTQTLLAWNPSSLALSGGRSLEMHNGSLYATVIGATNYLCRLDTTTAAADVWQPVIGGGGGAYNSKLVGDVLYVGGFFSSVESQPRGNIAAYDLTTATPTLLSWAPDADDRVNWIEYWNGNIYATGFFTAIAGSATSYFAEISDAVSGPAVNTGWNINATNEMFHTKVKGNVIYYFTYSNPLKEVYLPTHTATTWSVNFSSSIAHDMYGLDASDTKVFAGGAWNISIQGVAKKIFGVVCARPYSPILNPLTITTAPANVCHGSASELFEAYTGSGANSYTWTVSPSETVTSFGDSAHVSFSVAGSASSYTVSLDGSNGCLSTNTATVVVNAYTLASAISAQQSSIICGDKDTLTVSGNNYVGGGTVTYSWTPSTALNTTSGDTVVSSSKNSLYYFLTSTSTGGCVGHDSIYLAVNPFSINLNHTAQTILCSTTDTIAVTNNYPGTGSLTYTWSPSSSVNTTNPIKVVASPIATTDYTITSSASDGCVGSTTSSQVFVNPITVTASATNFTITCGNNTTLSQTNNYPGAGTVTYTWSPSVTLNNANAASPVADPINITPYNLTISTPEGCTSTDGVTINVDALVVNTAGMMSSTCSNTVTLTTSNNSGNGGLVYSWSPSTGLSSATVASPSANPGTTTVYTVTMSLPSSGCAAAMAVDTVKVLPPAVPGICEITSDLPSLYNVVYWDKTSFSVTDSFIVYRETTTNVYTKIATIAYADSSKYIDTARSITPANGDPNVGTYRYKLAAKDYCGNLSGMSPYHNTVFFVDNHTGVFTWNLYAVENAATPVTQFDLMRDNANNGIWTLVGTVTGNQTTLNDPNYATYQSIANWRVEAQGFNCTPTARQANGTQGAVVKSKSNITNNRQIGVKNNFESNIGLYPNPTNGSFVIDLGTAQGKVSVKVISLIGEEVYSASATAAEKLAVDLGAYQSGIYLVQITTSNATVIKRIVKN